MNENTAVPRVLDIAGIHLRQRERVLALVVAQQDRETAPSPFLPLDVGVSALLDELDTVTSALTPQPTTNDEAHHRFLSDVDLAVPAGLAVHLIRLTPAAHPPRFSASLAATEKHWGDQVTHLLAHRNARRLRDRISEITGSLHDWLNTPTTGQQHFTWVRQSTEPLHHRKSLTNAAR